MDADARRLARAVVQRPIESASQSTETCQSDARALARAIAGGHHHAPQKRAQRSWESIEHARDQRLVHIAKRKALDAESSKREADTAAAVILRAVGGAARCLGKTLHLPKLSSLAEAAVTLLRSGAPGTVKYESESQRRDAAIACRRVATFGHMEMQRRFDRQLITMTRKVPIAGDHSTACSTLVPWIPRRMLSYSHQFDSTTQRMRPLTLVNDGSRVAEDKMRYHIFMQSGATRTFEEISGAGVYEPAEPEPWIIRGSIFLEPNGPLVLQAFLKNLPFKWHEHGMMSLVAGTCDGANVSLTTDRGSENNHTGQWCAGHCKQCLPINMTFHLEPCGAHGVALVKNRSSFGRGAAMSLNSYSRLTRDFKVSWSRL